MLSGYNHNSFRINLIRLNKALNKWVKENLPVTSEILTEAKKKEIAENTAQAKGLQVQVNTPSRLFSFYLFGETNDDHIVLDPSKPLNEYIKGEVKEIVNHIKSIKHTETSTADVLEKILDAKEGIPPFLDKIHVFFNYFDYETNKQIDWSVLLECAKIEFALIRLAEKLEKSSGIKRPPKNAYSKMIRNHFGFHLIEMYTEIAYFIAFRNTDVNLDFIHSEFYLGIAKELSEKISIPTEHNIPKVLNMMLKYTEAKIAYDRGEFTSFLAYAEKGNKLFQGMQHNARCPIKSDPGFNMYFLLGDYYLSINRYYLAMTHYANALHMKNDPTLYTVSEERFSLLQKKYNESYEKHRAWMREEISKLFPNSVIIINSKTHFITTFIKLNKLPEDRLFNKENITEYRFVDQPIEGSEGLIKRGITIKIGLKPDGIQEMKELLDRISNKIFQEEEKESKQKTALSPCAPPLAHSNEMKAAIPENTHSETPIETIPAKKEKIKTRPKKEALPHNNPVLRPPAIASNILHANEFGFSVEGNPPITPIYCSHSGQKNKRTSLFVVWEGIKNLDKETEDLFEKMLNPTQEGIRIANPLNQAGPKLWKNPSSLTDWTQCGLRFKAIGAAGSTRVFANPKEEITVDENGNGRGKKRYLFSLGKPINK